MQFFSRKKRYSLDLCAICGPDHVFTYTFVGWPNSVHDARVWSSTAIARNPDACFSTGEYLLGDSAYPCSNTLVAPYKRPLANRPANRTFNTRLSNIRIDIEHAFGILKGRWQSLSGLRVRISNHKRYQFAVQWIVACTVLHNILIQEGDEWEEEEGWWTEEEIQEHDEILGEVQGTLGGSQRREQVKQVVLNMIGVDADN